MMLKSTLDPVTHRIVYLYSNIRNIQNKLYFTKTHFDANVSTNDVLLIQNYDCPYKNDTTNQVVVY